MIARAIYKLGINVAIQQYTLLIAPLQEITAVTGMFIAIKFNKNLAIANRSRVSCINTNNNTMTLKSGLEVTQGH